MREPTQEELLICLIEECGEVIQAATKILRFGRNNYYQDGLVNHIALAREIGDFYGISQRIELNQDELYERQMNKIEKIKKHLDKKDLS